MKQATGLPGNIKIGFLFPIKPNPKGLPGLIETFQNFIFYFLYNIYNIIFAS